MQSPMSPRPGARVRPPRRRPVAVAKEPGESATVRKRRDEIVTAATDIIATEGIHKLSLARIEQRVKMSRGQLTYYFRKKEHILLAVFDRMLLRMIAEATADGERAGVGTPGDGRMLDKFRYGMGRMMASGGADVADLRALVHTFLAQVQHEPDYRRKLAEANAGWRAHVAADVTATGTTTAPLAVASVVMALFQGLGDQLAVDPDAFDRAAVAELCYQLLGTLFEGPK
jgi:AcrR family transcriptional regulator